MPRRDAVDLLPQASDEDVDGAVAVCLPSPPDLLQQLVAGDDAAAVERERVEQLELGRRQTRALPVHERLHLARVDPELLDLDRLAPPLRRRPDAPPCGGPDARDKLSHREGLDQVVVGPDLERVDAVVFRATRGDAIEIEELRIDPREVQAFVGGKSAGLTPTEFRLLYTLALDRGRVVTRDELLQKVWGRRETHRDRTVDVFVRRLRQKIDRPAATHSFIQTRFGVGYKLEPELKVVSQTP